MTHLLLLFLLASLTSISASNQFLGVNYGTSGNNLPAPDHAIKLIQSINGGGIRIYDSNSTILQAASSAKLRIAVSVPNELITSIAYNQTTAKNWIKTNVLPFKKRISYIFVGNEVFSNLTGTNSTWPALVPAMANIYHALLAKNLIKISVSTTFAMDCIDTIYPPSSAKFRSDIPYSNITSLLKFLKDTNSYYFVNVYPYDEWSRNYKTISLDYALFQAKQNKYYLDSGTNLTYTNLLDQMLDAVISATTKLGYNNIKLGISETGWPNAGDISQIGASVYNAAMYNRNLARILRSRKGTPLRPKIAMPSFVFALFNENLRAGAGTERHWGLFYPNETAVYPVDLSGKKPLGSYPPIPLPTNNEPYPGKIWCVLTSDESKLTDDFYNSEEQRLCNFENNYCGDLINQVCFLSVMNPHDRGLFIRFDMNYLWQQFRDSGMPCYFDGYAEETTVDPSINTCIFTAH